MHSNSSTFIVQEEKQVKCHIQPIGFFRHRSTCLEISVDITFDALHIDYPHHGLDDPSFRCAAAERSTRLGDTLQFVELEPAFRADRDFSKGSVYRFIRS